jgi:hypothetical protein
VVEAPVVVPEKPKPVEKKVVARPEKPKPVIVAKPEPAPAPKPAGTAKVVSLDRSWGFLVLEAQEGKDVKVGDRLYAHLTDGRRVPIVVRRISGNLVSAVPEGQKISDEMVGASVSGN